MSTAEKNILERDLTMAFIDFDVEMLERYLDVVEAQLQKARKREISAYRKHLRVKNEAESEEASVDLQAINENHEQFVRFARYTFLMLTFMVFEARAKEFCKYIRNKKQLSLKIDDLAGKNLLEKLINYLCRYATLLDEKWQLWQELRGLQLIRNKIAHQGGICTKEQAESNKALLNNVPGLDLQKEIEGLRIDLNLNSCRYAISTIKYFFEHTGHIAGFRNGG